MNSSHLAVSKFLSYVLRHRPDAISLALDREGWVSMADLIANARKAGQNLDETLVRHVVETNGKQRFEISDDGLRIRALQGHSTPHVARDLPPCVPPERLYHGTAEQFLEVIRAEGLRSGKRHHVHLSEDVDTARRVGQRHGAPVVLAVAAGEMHRAGYVFHESENGVWLTEFVPPGSLKEG